MEARTKELSMDGMPPLRSGGRDHDGNNIYWRTIPRPTFHRVGQWYEFLETAKSQAGD